MKNTSIRNENHITRERFLETIEKIHQSETKPIKIINDDGTPTIHEVINNQKRLAIMLEYTIQLLTNTKEELSYAETRL